MRIGIMIGEVRGPATADTLRQQATGVDSLWTAQALGWDALTALTVAAPHAPRATLGTAVVPVRQRHPLTLAGQALSVQAATGNRLTLGVGSGIGVMVGGMFGLPVDRPVAFMREYLAALLPLLHGEPVAAGGEFLTVRGTVAVPGTIPPPVLLAALGPAMLRLAGTAADGAITWLTGARTLESHVVPTVLAAAAGRPTPRMVAGLPVCVTTDVADARSRLADRFGMAAQVPEYRRVLDHEGATGPQDVALIGDEETVARQIHRLEETGITEFVAAPSGTETEQHHTTAFLHHLSKQNQAS